VSHNIQYYTSNEFKMGQNSFSACTNQSYLTITRKYCFTLIYWTKIANCGYSSWFYLREIVAKITQKFLLDVTSRHANPTRNINRDITDIGNITYIFFVRIGPFRWEKATASLRMFFSSQYKSSTNSTRILILQVESRLFSVWLNYRIQLVRLTVSREFDLVEKWISSQEIRGFRSH